MIIYDQIVQMSPEWFALKSGVPSASKADKILTPTGKLSSQSVMYMNELLAEMAGYGDEPFEPNEWMLRGIEMEPEARAFFEFETGRTVAQVAWITNDEGTAGCSPDGITGVRTAQAGFEVKCPKASTHIGYLRNGELPPKYAPQIHWSMAITGLQDWYFMSYFPGLDPLIVLVSADDYTTKVKVAIDEFTKTLSSEAERLGIQTARLAA